MVIMKQINLSRIDLNLLVVFDALLAERHVTRAAARIGLTQPATSHALKRLRALFDDPLFVRSSRGMVPTPVALEAGPAVRSVLEQVEGILRAGRSFVPGQSDRQFVVGLSDYAALVLLPRLLARLDEEAPGVTLLVRSTSHGIGLPMLDDGSVELIAGNFPEPPAHMKEELLYEEDFLCACRDDHAAFSGAGGLDRYLSLRHLNVSTKGSARGYVDAVLSEQGLTRHVAATVGHFLMAPALAGSTELIVTEPRRLLEPLADRFAFRLLHPPVEIPTFRVVQAWHTRCNADPGHVWLRRILREVASADT